MRSNYDKFPYCDSGLDADACAVGWDAIFALISTISTTQWTICIETYPGAFISEIESEIAKRLNPSIVVRASDAYWHSSHIIEIFGDALTTDPVFGYMSDATVDQFFDPDRLQSEQKRLSSSTGIALVIGTGASLIAPHADCLVYADMARWEIQLRQRKNFIGNLGLENLKAPAAEKYKRAYFLDWRAADRLKLETLPHADFVLDTNKPNHPLMISGTDFQAALSKVVHAPMRLVPFFDPGPWGGQWMKEQFDLPPEQPNYAWCFDCVPEENSLLLGFGDLRFEVPAMDIVLLQPTALLGEEVQSKFGREFPIRFDLLDTMGGGNLSFQVHPLMEYIQQTFGLAYTQDESYYMLDAGNDAAVYLGLKSGISPAQLELDLRRANEGEMPFPVDDYINRISAKKHDHFLIPAGTPHCSGANSMVLEISATPYIFTFKLWDWSRLGLDGHPRHVHLDHGLNNIQWERDTVWVLKNLVNAIEPFAEGEGWQEERTGLHALEIIETRRYWFNRSVPLSTQGSVNVLNLVEGKEAVVESPEDRFAPFAVHYAETFIIPASAGSYTISPLKKEARCGVIRAFVRK